MTAVADQLTRQPIADRRGQEQRRFVLLDDGERLRFRAAARLVIGREGEEDHEAGEDREAGREHAEYARGPIAVGEVAAFRRPAPDQQQRGDRHHDGDREDQDPPDEVHAGSRAS